MIVRISSNSHLCRNKIYTRNRIEKNKTAIISKMRTIAGISTNTFTHTHIFIPMNEWMNEWKLAWLTGTHLKAMNTSELPAVVPPSVHMSIISHLLPLMSSSSILRCSYNGEGCGLGHAYVCSCVWTLISFEWHEKLTVLYGKESIKCRR